MTQAGEVCLCVFLLKAVTPSVMWVREIKGEWKFDVYEINIICMVVIITEVPEAAMHVDMEKPRKIMSCLVLGPVTRVSHP